MNKRVMLIATFLCTLGVATALYGCLKKDMTGQKAQKKEVMSCIEGRVCIEDEETIKIGNNEKELKNGYYDVLLEKTETGFIAHINKLWKTEFNETLYEEEYVKEVAMFLISRMKSEVECQEVMSFMLEGYIESKEEKEIKVDGETAKEESEVTEKLDKETMSRKAGVYEILITVKEVGKEEKAEKSEVAEKEEVAKEKAKKDDDDEDNSAEDEDFNPYSNWVDDYGKPMPKGIGDWIASLDCKTGEIFRAARDRCKK